MTYTSTEPTSMDSDLHWHMNAQRVFVLLWLLEVRIDRASLSLRWRIWVTLIHIHSL